jgi:hypothetical protein
MVSNLELNELQSALASLATNLSAKYLLKWAGCQLFLCLEYKRNQNGVIFLFVSHF